jgi:hypothetical protein
MENFTGAGNRREGANSAAADPEAVENGPEGPRQGSNLRRVSVAHKRCRMRASCALEADRREASIFHPDERSKRRQMRHPVDPAGTRPQGAHQKAKRPEPDPSGGRIKQVPAEPRGFCFGFWGGASDGRLERSQVPVTRHHVSKLFEVPCNRHEEG